MASWAVAAGCLTGWRVAAGSTTSMGRSWKADAPAWRVFYTPIGDCHILDTWHSTGLRGTGSHDYTMDDVFVPNRLVTRHPLRAPSLRPSRHYTYSAMVIAVMASVALGAARGSVDSLMEVLERKLELPAAGRRHP